MQVGGRITIMSLLAPPPVRAIERYRQLVQLGGCASGLTEGRVKSFAFIVAGQPSLSSFDGCSILVDSLGQMGPPESIDFECVLSAQPNSKRALERLTQVNDRARLLIQHCLHWQILQLPWVPMRQFSSPCIRNRWLFGPKASTPVSSHLGQHMRLGPL